MEDSKLVSSKKMDMDISYIQSILQEVNFPSSVQDLKSPTEQYVVNLISTFLKRFNINVAFIERPTMDQQDILLAFELMEDINIVRLINLHVTMAGISSNIFLKDLCITDITSPSSKRLRRQAKFFANFVIYANQKQSLIEERQHDINEKRTIMQAILDERAAVQQAMNNRERDMKKKLALKQQIIDNIKDIESRNKEKRKEDNELLAELNGLKEKEQKATECLKNLTNQYSKLSMEIGNLQSEIVNTPEKHETRLRGLMEQRKLKIESRDMMVKTLQDKLQSIEHSENCLSLVEQLTYRFNKIPQICVDLKQERVESDTTENMIQSLKASMQELQLEKESVMRRKEQLENDVQELCFKQEKLLASIHSSVAIQQSKKKEIMKKWEEAHSCWNEAQVQKTELQEKIEKLEEETLEFTKRCQEIYDTEIKSEAELRKTI